MDYVSRLDFQINRLGYKFNDVDLLSEALTHSLDEKNVTTDFPQDKTLHRLAVIGDSVLKLLVCQYVIQTSGLVDEGILTSKKNTLINKRVQNYVGRQLVGPHNYGNAHQGNNYIKINSALWKKKSFKVPYNLFAKSILGAVFVDAGGTYGYGLAKSIDLFQKLWKDVLTLNLDSTRTDVKELNHCFPVDPIIKHVWKVLLQSSTSEMERLLGYNFKNCELLCEALTHKSFDAYKIFPSWNEIYHPNYQRLEFLGDSVLGLVITEFMFHEYPAFEPFEIVRKVTPRINDAFLRQIASQLLLKKFVRKAEQLNGTWNRTGDIVESIIGAMYVDDGIRKSREFILKRWKLVPSKWAVDQSSALDELQRKLGYKFKDKGRLQAILIHDDRDFQSYEDRKRRFLKDARSGEILINLYVKDYVIRTCNSNEKLGDMERHQRYLCMTQVWRAIVRSLELNELIQTSRYQSIWETAFSNNSEFVFAIFGAILNSEGGGAITTAEEIFYRLWNPYLEHCPKRSLLECFPSTSLEQCDLRANLGYLIPDDDFNTIQWNIGCYKFQQRNLLEQALTQGASLIDGAWVKGNSEKFEFFGQSIVEFLKDSQSLRTTEFDAWLEINQINAVNAWMLACNVNLLRKYYVLQPRDGTVELPSTLSIFYSVIGAIFVDSPGTLYEKLSNVLSCYKHCIRHIKEVFTDLKLPWKYYENNNYELKSAKLPKYSFAQKWSTESGFNNARFSKIRETINGSYLQNLPISAWNGEFENHSNSNHFSTSTQASSSVGRLQASYNDNYLCNEDSEEDYTGSINQRVPKNKKTNSCALLVWYIVTFILTVWFYTTFVNYY